MKAVVIRKFGAPEGLAVVDLPAPVPAPGQVRIAVEAIGVGGVDAVIRRGMLAAHGFREGHLLGSEVAGRVTAVGEGVNASWRGRRVWASTGLAGGYAEQAVAAVEDVLPLPDGLTGAAAVAVTTSSAERGARLRDLGATHVLDRSGEGGGPGAPLGFDVVIDVVGGPRLPHFLDRLNPDGRFMAVGVVGGQPPENFGMRLMDAFRRSLSFATFSSDTVPTPDRTAVRTSQFAEAANGNLHTAVHEVLPLDHAASAHQKMDAGEVFGRIVLTP
ncbi:zinc-binding dehydrogenase [Actinomadura sp. NPDC048955]|uniref:zinc-binding dehydrogenase n=1 Tax=Actinomadura sp. NPDC048955 TaxID=3158228 RepID=UPI0033F8D47F